MITKILIALGISMPFTCIKTYSQDTIHWRPTYQLKWNDFKAAPDKSAPFAAQTDCSISYAYTFQNNVFSVSVISYFNRNRSWAKNKTTSDSSLLKHEQGHFNINELFARKMRQA